MNRTIYRTSSPPPKVEEVGVHRVNPRGNYFVSQKEAASKEDFEKLQKQNDELVYRVKRLEKMLALTLYMVGGLIATYVLLQMLHL